MEAPRALPTVAPRRTATSAVMKFKEATTNRRDAAGNGGAASSPIRIASHVDPQMAQRNMNAALRKNRLASN